MSAWAILLPAFAMMILIAASHVYFGLHVLARGIIFIDLAIAQIAALGVLVAAWLGLGGHALEGETWLVQLVAAGSALTGAALLRWTERHWPKEQEAIIGVTFILAATLAILVLARDPHGGEHLRELLAGQVLWVGWSDLIPVAVLYALVLSAWFSPWGGASRIKFYLLFALAVTASVQLVGVYLVFASLIIPALAIRRLGGGRALLLGYVLGVGGYALGLAGSAVLDLPSGPSIVWALALTAGGYAFGSGIVRRSD